MAKIDTGYRVGYVGEIGAQGKTPLEILDSVGDWQKPFLLKHWIPIFLGAAGIATAASSNWMARRPVMSGMYSPHIHRHLAPIHPLKMLILVLSINHRYSTTYWVRCWRLQPRCRVQWLA